MVSRADNAAENVLRPERDSRGRFAPGNTGGPGNPRVRHMAEMREAIRGAISAPIVAGVLKAVAKKAIGGDVAAARLLLDHVLGRPRELPPEHEFELPSVETVRDVPTAFSVLFQAAAAGSIDPDTLTRLAKALGEFSKAAEVADKAEAERVAAEQAKVDLSEFERYL